MKSIPLYSLAHARTGDKGNRSSIALMLYESKYWDLVVEQITEERVAELFRFRNPSAVKRYLIPQLQSMNFVIDDVLDGGVNGSLNLDTHGKCLSSLLLTLPITHSDTEEAK